MAYDLEKDIEGLGKRGRKKGAKKRAANKAFADKRKGKKKKASKKTDENWVERLKRKVHELLKGDKAYANKKKK
jgi:hypothetical protein